MICLSCGHFAVSLQRKRDKKDNTRERGQQTHKAVKFEKVSKIKKEKERVTKMKRLCFTVVALLSMTMTFAGNENGNDTGSTKAEATGKIAARETNAGAYEIGYNMRRLGETLGLTLSQMNSVEALNRNFRTEMAMVAHATEKERKEMLNNAVEKDFKCMSYVLTPEQFTKYQTLINVTLSNRGLDK